MVRKKIAVFSILFAFTPHVHPVTAGSNTAVAVQTPITLPNTNSNSLLGFSRFTGGFTLQDSTTTCTFDSIFPVSGNVSLNGGNLYLNQDLIFNNNVYFSSLGSIWGYNYSIELSTTDAPLVIPTISNTVTVSTITSLASVAQPTIANCVDWSYDSAYVSAGSSYASPSSPEINIYSFNGSNLTLATSLNTYSEIYNVAWHPLEYDLAVSCTGNIHGTSYDLIVYNFNSSTNTLSVVAGVQTGIKPTMTMWNYNGQYLAVSGQSSKLSVYSFSNNNLSLVMSKSISTTPSPSSLTWSPDGTALAVGCLPLSGQNDIQIFSFNGTTLAYTGGVTTSQQAAVLDWMSVGQGSFLAAGFFTTSGGSQYFRMYTYSGGTITEQTSARYGETNSVIGLQWSPDNNYLVVGLAATTTTPTRVYQFNPNTITITSLCTATGSATLFGVGWSPNQLYFGTADTSDNLIIYGVNSTSNQSYSSLPLLIDSTKVVLGCPVYLRAPLNARKSCVISGRGNELNLTLGGSINVKPGGTLILENLYLTGVSGSNIACTDPAGNLIFRNCVLQLSSNYTFSIGSINFDQNVYIYGPSNSFIYTSAQTSQINTLSNLYFETGTSFQYLPAAANKNLIVMQDTTSSLYLDGMILQTSHTGLRLNTGQLYFHNSVTMTNAASNLAEGIEFGANLGINFLSKAFVNLYGFYRYGT